jgi:hypothetical protein
MIQIGGKFLRRILPPPRSSLTRRSRSIPITATKEETMRVLKIPSVPSDLALRAKPLLILVLVLLAGSPCWAAFTSEFRLASCTWDDNSRENPYFSLKPGHQLVLEGEEDGEELRVEITVLRERKPISFQTANGQTVTLRARVVEEREFEDGELVEVSRNFFSLCRQTSDVFYFGEEVDIYEDGEVVDHHGAWQAGVDGALPGLIMPGTFLLGSRYFQEVAPGVALDRGRNVGEGLEITVPAGTFRGCVAVEDSDALSPSPGDLKVYCPNVGLVIDETLELVEVGTDGGE